eukprot:COSAG06_NODE_7260_length_2566_cov_206.737738_2_plen_484_part_00
MEQAGLYSPNNSVGMNDAEVKDLWRTRVKAYKNRPGAAAATRRGGATNLSGRWDKGKRFDPVTDAQGNRTGWQQVEVKLTPAQETRVVDVFYRDLKATVGFEALWQALADRDDPYTAPDRGGISRQALLNWYRKQLLPQLAADAPRLNKAKASVPMPEKQAPLVLLQCDVINLQALKYGKKTRVLNIIDRFTKYTIQEALERETQDECAQVIIDFVDTVRDLTVDGEWPWETVLLCDNGASFGKSFKEQIESYEPKITIRHSEAYVPLSLIEGSNRQWRAVTRRYLGAMGLPENRWYGWAHPRGRGYTLRAINALLNSKKDASLGNQSAQDVWEAGIEIINKTQTPTDVQIIRFAAEAQRERAQKRRGPSAGVTQSFTIGTEVREAVMKYVKASSSLRGNKMKMGWPRAWQISTSKVTAVRGGDDRPYEYQLDDKDRWVSHDRLKRVYGEVDPPAATLQDRDFFPFKQVGNTTYYRGYPWPEG